MNQKEIRDERGRVVQKAVPKSLKKTKTQELIDLADAIHAHLKRFEKSPKINKIDPHYKTHPYYYVSAAQCGRRVEVTYVTYQGASKLSKEQAEGYLVWLDAGNVGTHYEYFESVKLDGRGNPLPPKTSRR